MVSSVGGVVGTLVGLGDAVGVPWIPRTGASVPWATLGAGKVKLLFSVGLVEFVELLVVGEVVGSGSFTVGRPMVGATLGTIGGVFPVEEEFVEFLLSVGAAVSFTVGMPTVGETLGTSVGAFVDGAGLASASSLEQINGHTYTPVDLTCTEN